MASIFLFTPATTALAVLLAGAAATLPVQAQVAPPDASQAQAASAGPPATSAAPAAPASAKTPDFPADAQALSASELDARLRGKVYTAKLANGMHWRGDYKASGYVFVNLSNNAKDTGTWRTEDSKVCVDYRGAFRSGCTEMRAGAQQALYARNSTTGVVTVMTPE